MTARELIEYLKKFNPDNKVQLFDDKYATPYEIKNIVIDKNDGYFSYINIVSAEE